MQKFLVPFRGLVLCAGLAGFPMGADHQFLLVGFCLISMASQSPPVFDQEDAIKHVGGAASSCRRRSEFGCFLCEKFSL